LFYTTFHFQIPSQKPCQHSNTMPAGQGKINLSTIRPKKRSPSQVKIQPRCPAQFAHTPIRQAYPKNQVNSMEACDAGMHPCAWLKQPISNTCPWGLANVCRNMPFICMQWSGHDTTWPQFRQTITGEDEKPVSDFSRVMVSGVCLHTIHIFLYLPVFTGFYEYGIKWPLSGQTTGAQY